MIPVISTSDELQYGTGAISVPQDMPELGPLKHWNRLVTMGQTYGPPRKSKNLLLPSLS
jgi:hypothetical protein